jgi:hypothetical protein
MKLYFGGSEVPSWRKILHENNVKSMSLSYIGLSRRVKFVRPWLIVDHYNDDVDILLDGGAYTVNKEDSELTEDELLAIAEHYQSFVEQNIERIDCFTEFDALPLGRAWIEDQRDNYPDDKLMPVWHGSYGVDELERLASRYGRVGILQTELGERSLVPMLNNLVARYGVKLHGLAMTKPDTMREVRWDSVGSTSWISPSTFGDTHVWTGRELLRYPTAYKEKARKDHRNHFINAGFDPDLILNDDRNEVLRLGVWSWEQLIADLNRRMAFRPVTNLAEMPAIESAEITEDAVDNPDPQTQNTVLVPAPPKKRVKEMMPGLHFVPGGDDSDQVFERTGDNLRNCDNCPLSTKGCPRFEPGSECGYAMPIMIRTPRDMENVENALLEMQTERVMFMKMSEDLDFGADPSMLSKEMDRLHKMIKDKREGNMEKTTIHISQQKPGQLGMIGRIFGEEAAERATAYDDPVPVDAILEQTESND